MSVALVLCVFSFSTFAQPGKGVQTASKFQGAAPRANALRVQLEGGSIRLEGYSGDRITYLVHDADSRRTVDRASVDLPL